MRLHISSGDRRNCVSVLIELPAAVARASLRDESSCQEVDFFSLPISSAGNHIYLGLEDGKRTTFPSFIESFLSGNKIPQ